MRAHPKIQNIVEAISHNQISVALNDINSLLNKQKDREGLAAETLETIHLLRALCQARADQFGESRATLLNYMKNNANNTANIDSDILLWVNHIGATLGLYGELKTFFEPTQSKKTATDEKTALSQIGLPVKDYDFKGGQTAALKAYKDLKQPKYMLASIMFQYLSIVKAPEVPKDMTKALEICYLFMNKLRDELKVTDQQKALENLLNRQFIKLYVEILWKQNKKDLLVKTLKEFPKVFEDDYEKYFTPLIGLYSEDKSTEVKSVILDRYSEIFKQNNNLDTYRLCYNLYKQYTSFLLSHIPKEAILDHHNIAVEHSHGHEESTYHFAPDAGFEHLLGVFWKSLGNSYKIYEENFKNHQHYRNAVKTVLTCKLEILRQIILAKLQAGKSVTEEALIVEYIGLLELYTKHFLRIFTFPDEIYPFLNVLPAQYVDSYLNATKQEVAQSSEKSRCVADVNYIKVRNVLKDVGRTIEEVESEMNELIGKYTEAMTVLYENKKVVEKGERLDNDEYIVILVDVVIKFLDEKGIQEIDDKLFNLVVKTWYVLELALDKTPYNFDLKNRAMDLYGRFSVTERLMDIYKTMDIKAVQTDTLGYTFYKTHASLCMFDPIFDSLKENVRFHIESLKESKESLLSCIKHDNLEKVEEFHEWDKLMQRSYFKHITYFHLAEQEFRILLRKSVNNEAILKTPNLNFEYLMEQVINRFQAHLSGDEKNKFTFNFDVKTPQRNTVVAAHLDSHAISIIPVDEKKIGKIHIDYLSILNNPLILGIRAYRLDILYTIVQANETNVLTRMQRALQGFKEAYQKVNIEGFFDFRQFATKTKQTSLLHLNHKEGYEYTFVKETVEFELLNLEFEIALTNLYQYWLELTIEKKEADGEVLIKEAETKFETLVAHLESCFQKHLQEPWRIFNTDLRKLARVLDSTVEMLEIIGHSLQSMKSNVNRVAKKLSDQKQCTKLYKGTQATLKTFKERLESAFGVVAGILKEVLGGLESNEHYMLKQQALEVEKLFNAEVYNVAKIGKAFVTDSNRSLKYLISTFLGRLKEKSKSLKVIVE